MALTVRGLLSNRRLGLSIVAGSAGIDREIQWAHSIELDDPAPWLTGGELILTTGWRRDLCDPSWGDYLRRLDDAGVAALGFGVGIAHESIPAQLVAAAEERGLPLISVPLPLPFIAIVRSVTDRLAEDRVAEIRGVMDDQARMIRTAAERGVAGIATQLSRLIAGATVVLDPGLSLLAMEPAESTNLFARMTAEIGRRPDRWRGRGAVSVSDAEGQLTIQSVAGGPGSPGYIGVATASPLKPLHQLLLSQACALIALEWQQPRAVRERDNAIRASLLELALSGTLTGGLLWEHARSFGFGHDEQVVALSITSSLSVADTLAVAREALALLTTPYLAAAGQDEVIVLTGSDRWDQAADELLVRLKASKAVNVVIGIGGSVPWDNLYRTVQQARHARYGGQAGRREQVEFDKMGAFGVLLATHTPEVLAELADSVLGPLDDYVDKQDGRMRRAGDLVETVRVFLQHNGHWESAAASMGIHCHSLRYRIRKVEQLTGRDLESSTDRSEFLIAIAAREFNRNVAYRSTTRG